MKKSTNDIVRIIIGSLLAGVAIIGTGGYLIYNHFNTPKYDKEVCSMIIKDGVTIFPVAEFRVYKTTSDKFGCDAMYVPAAFNKTALEYYEGENIPKLGNRFRIRAVQSHCFEEMPAFTALSLVKGGYCPDRIITSCNFEIDLKEQCPNTRIVYR